MEISFYGNDFHQTLSLTSDQLWTAVRRCLASTQSSFSSCRNSGCLAWTVCITSQDWGQDSGSVHLLLCLDYWYALWCPSLIILNRIHDDILLCNYLKPLDNCCFLNDCKLSRPWGGKAAISVPPLPCFEVRTWFLCSCAVVWVWVMLCTCAQMSILEWNGMKRDGTDQNWTGLGMGL